MGAGRLPGPPWRSRAAWLDARQQGRSVVVMAADHDTVDHLAMRARACRVAAGQVEPEGVTVNQQTVGVGDKIVTTLNDRRVVTTTRRVDPKQRPLANPPPHRNGSAANSECPCRTLRPQSVVPMPADTAPRAV